MYDCIYIYCYSYARVEHLRKNLIKRHSKLDTSASLFAHFRSPFLFAGLPWPGNGISIGAMATLVGHRQRISNCPKIKESKIVFPYTYFFPQKGMYPWVFIRRHLSLLHPVFSLFMFVIYYSSKKLNFLFLLQSSIELIPLRAPPTNCLHVLASLGPPLTPCCRSPFPFSA